MAKLGDFFPEDLKEEFAENNLVSGSVLRFQVPDTTPPKLKFVIVLAKNNTKLLIATIFINSEINPNIFNSEQLKNLHYLLQQKKYSFLTHDSYADCSKIKERETTKLLTLLKQTPSIHIGKLEDEDFAAIKLIIKNTRTIAIDIKKQYDLFY